MAKKYGPRANFSIFAEFSKVEKEEKKEFSKSGEEEGERKPNEQFWTHHERLKIILFLGDLAPLPPSKLQGPLEVVIPFQMEAVIYKGTA